MNPIHLQFAKFGALCFRSVLEHSNVDGADLEGMAIASGLMEQITAFEPCNNEVCECSDFPTPCNRTELEVLEEYRNLTGNE